MNEINIHPADELAGIREEIKQLEAREAQLRAALINGNDADRDGRQYRAFVQQSTRESIDKAAITAALGEEVIAPFLKKTEVKTLKLAAKKETPDEVENV